jgi:hypothetical protein
MADQFPSKPTCHKDERHLVPDEWRPPSKSEPYEYPFRSCSYCGSIHPEDLVAWLEKGASLYGADWKYGWPHKYYVEGIPNPIAGKIVEIGGEYYRGHKKPIMGAASPTTHAKWYNLHLNDHGYSQETLEKLVKAINAHLDRGIDFHGEKWGINAKGVYYAPEATVK